MLTARSDHSAGFTLIEVIIALVILAFVVLGSAYTTGTLARNAAEAEIEAMALQAAESRISRIKMDTRYLSLDSVYTGVEGDLPGLPGFSRETTITRIRTPGAGGLFHDYQRVLVAVSGPLLGSPIIREIVVAAP